MSAFLQKPDWAKAQREAHRILEESAIVEPPVNPTRIARDLGTNVYFVTFAPQSSNISGFYDCDENAIFVNKDEYPLRQTFTIAHELGHSILHGEWARSSEYKILLRNSSATSEEVHEREANAFAAHLLVPRFLLDKYRNRLSADQLSTLFAVSAPVIKNRLAFEYGNQPY